MGTGSEVQGRRDRRLCSLDCLTMPKQHYLTASEIGTYCFCRRAWHLGKIGLPSASTRARGAGTAWHEAHSYRVANAGRSRRVAHVFGFVFLVLVFLLSLTWVCKP